MMRAKRELVMATKRAMASNDDDDDRDNNNDKEDSGNEDCNAATATANQ